MSRIARVTAVNYPHHITQRGNNRTDTFLEDNDRQFYLEILKKYAQRYAFDIWAYCLMSNHVHILAVPRKEDSLARGMGGTNLVYTQYINRKYKRSGRLWQNRFFSTIVDTDRYLWAVARYIERNPLRAGLVPKADAYKWSSCRTHMHGDANKYLSSTEWLQESERIEYQKLLQSENDADVMAIRQATSTGRPFGSANFIELLEKELDRSLTANKVGRPSKQQEKNK